MLFGISWLHFSTYQNKNHNYCWDLLVSSELKDRYLLYHNATINIASWPKVEILNAALVK